MRAEWLMIFCGALVVAFYQSQVPQKRLKDAIVFGYNEDIVSYPASVLRASSFGYSRASSSLLWLRFLQQTPPEKVEPNQVSWIYHDLDSLTELDPKFYPAYELGGIFLSVVTEDKRGAERILLKGIRAFPDRWRLRAYLAYHYQWELAEPEKAAEQYLAAAALPGASGLVKVLAGSAAARKNGKRAAIELLRNFLKSTEKPDARERILEKIKKLEGQA